MAWDHLSITSPHLVYIILGGFTSLFMLCSSVIKERMYIGEATVATICGLIFGPHAANLINPASWGNVDVVTLEFSRIVLVVQCFAVGVELPKFYMERHWKSVVFLLVPVMTVGWLITSLFVWWMIPPLDWLESLVVAACVTATDPVLASSVVGKGKFAKRVPKHLRDVLSAESGCNDGMAFPFIYLSLYLIQDNRNAGEVTLHWVVYTILYECIFGAFFGFMIGYVARHGIKFAEKHDLIDRESFLVFYFVLALFCAGSGSILGVDDLLVGFSAGVGFSNDGWFGQKTEESHVSNVIDLLLNLTYFVFLGTIIPWEQYNNPALGLTPWRLVVIALFVIFFRRIPIMMALKPFIPDIKTWREALFAGHFGPIGVGAIFVAILARAELESESSVPLAELPPPGVPNYTLMTLVWPIVTFLVISSIIVHGSSVAVFTLGKHINTLTITMSYTAAPEDGPSWMNRLPRISSQSRSQARNMSDTDADDLKMPEFPPGTLPPVGLPGQWLRRVRDEESTSRHGSRASSRVARRKKTTWDNGIGPGGPISQSAIFPSRQNQSEQTPPGLEEDNRGRSLGTNKFLHPESARQHPRLAKDPEKEDTEKKDTGPVAGPPSGEREVEVYDEGDNIVVEDESGEVLAVGPTSRDERAEDMPSPEAMLKKAVSPHNWTYDALKRRFGDWRAEEVQKRKEKKMNERRHEPARAYQFGNTIIVEDEDGEVVKKYELPQQRLEREGGDLVSQGLKMMGMSGTSKPGEKTGVAGTSTEGEIGGGLSKIASNILGYTRSAAGESSSQRVRKKSVAEEAEDNDDRNIRFKIGGVGQRMTKDAFIKEMQKLDKGTRGEVVDHSSASASLKDLAKQDAPDEDGGSSHRSGKQVAPGEGSEPRSSLSESLGRSSASQSSEASPSRMPDDAPSRSSPETAVERRRRLAVLKSVGGGSNDDARETAAERRRREAALGMSSMPNEDEDSDDDDTPRVPPARRGIRFADNPGAKRH